MSQEDKPYKKMGDRIEKFRKHLGKNKSEFSRCVDISSSYYGKVARGENIITSNILIKIIGLDAGVNIVWLLTGNGEMLQTEDEKLDKRIYKLEVENEILMKLLKAKEESTTKKGE